MLALREKLPAADGRQRLALQNKEGRNTAWQVYNLLGDRAWNAESLPQFEELAGVINIFGTVVETTITDSGFEEILRTSRTKGNVVTAYASLSQGTRKYLCLGSIPDERIKHSDGLTCVKDLFQKIDATASLAFPENAGEITGEIQATRKQAQDCCKEHADAHVIEVWPPLASEWDKLKINLGGGIDFMTWKSMLPGGIKDFKTLVEKSKDTLQKVSTTRLAAQTKSTQIVLST